MLIPRCCKGCSNLHKGTCCCDLPTYCNEYVEENDNNVNDKQVYTNGTNYVVCTACLICGANVEHCNVLTGIAVCDKCRDAILKLREKEDGNS